MKKTISSLTILLVFTFGFVNISLDHKLDNLILENELTPIEKNKSFDSIKVELGRLLFFDKILSGNKDISCATCHHPDLGSGDDLALPIGTGGIGLGDSRDLGSSHLRIPRNSPEIFNRGEDEWHTMFWDGRLSRGENGSLDSPINQDLPEGLESLLAVQAMLPVLSRDEMRGRIGDRDINGNQNKLALISDAAPESIWKAIMDQVLQIEEYKSLFRKVYPEVATADLGFQHAANAIAAFEALAFTFEESLWDKYLSGNKDVLSESAKRGAMLFYGPAKCSSCHSGKLFTDQEFHNIAVPQLGPGKGLGRPYDFGRYGETGQWEHRFAFRTPPLRNVTLTGPWMHNGAYGSLREAILHHLDMEKYLKNYSPVEHLGDLQVAYQSDSTSVQMIMQTSTKETQSIEKLSAPDISDLLSFLRSLTDPAAKDLGHLVPDSVPSGLAVDRIITGR